jgi:hypothetical protein
MKKLRVKLVLTDAEARSLDYIIDNTADYPDVLAELFSGASEMKIAERALGSGVRASRSLTDAVAWMSLPPT